MYIYSIIAFVIGLAVTAIGMPRLLHICKSRGLYDVPNSRKVHHNNIPRLGGTFFAPAMVFGVIMAFVIMRCFSNSTLTFLPSTFIIAGGMFLIYLIGILDDLFGLNAKIKFLIQLVSALFMPLCDISINNLDGLFGIYELPVYVAYPLTIFVALLIINAVNLIDGIDGLASSLSLISLTAYTFLFLHAGSASYSIMAAGFAGSIIAFIYFNIFGKVDNNTKTFMGDTGSLILGYAMAFFSIKYSTGSSSTPPPAALLTAITLLIVPTFDLVRVAIMRMFHGVSIFHPDKTHIHHKFLAAGFSMHLSLIAIIALQFAFIMTNVLLYKAGTGITAIVVTDMIIYLLVIFLLDRKCNRQQPLRKCSQE